MLGAMNDMPEFPLEGGCACRAVRYRMERPPLFVHCCHCTDCQRETGSAFVLNALIETSAVTLLEGSPQSVETPTESGSPQMIVRCPDCHVAVWSHYTGAGDTVAFVRAGTLDDTAACPPDIHIFTRSKRPWVQLGDDVPVMEAFYRYRDLWPAEHFQRLLDTKPPR